MTELLRVLLLEDSDDDALLLEKSLEKEDFDLQMRRVQDREGLEQVLDADKWDIILSDYDMGGFSAPEALRMVQDKGMDLPFIVVSGTVGEEAAIEALRAGANDYVKKGDLEFLGTAIRRELAAAGVRREYAESLDRLEHLKSVLVSIRNVNRLIVREEDPAKLIEEACSLLVESRGYRGAWIALGDGTEPTKLVAGASWGSSLDRFKTELARGIWPACARRAVEQGTSLVHDIHEECRDCPLNEGYDGNLAVITSLGHDRRVYGVLGVAFPSEIPFDDQEREVLLEVAGDLALALHNIDLARRQQTAEQLLDAAVGAGRIGLWSWNPETGEVVYSKEWKAQFGYSEEEITSHFDEWKSRVHPDDLEETIHKVRSAVDHPDGLLEVEFRLRHKDGSYRWVLSRAKVQRGPGGNPVRMLGSSIDITERKKVEEELRQFDWLLEKQASEHEGAKTAYEAPYRDVTELNTRRVILDAVSQNNLDAMGRDLMALLDTSVAVYEANGDYAYGLFDSDWCQLLDAASFALCGTDDTREALCSGRWLCHENCWNDSARAAIESGAPTDIECVGGIRLYAVPIFAGDEVVGALNMGYGNPPRDEATLAGLAERFEMDVEEIRAAAMQYKPRPRYIIDVAKRRCHSMARLIGTTVERERFEQQLGNEKARAQRYLDVAAVMLLALDQEGRISMINRQGYQILGADSDKELLGRNWFDFVPEDDRERVEGVFQAIAKGELEAFRHAESKIQTLSGDIRWIEWNNALMHDDQDRIVGVLSSGRDVTDRVATEEALRQSEDQLRQAQRMESVGRLAGGVAHDFNNILQVITSFAELGESRKLDGDRAKGYFQQILEAAERAAGLTRQLLAFSRRQVIQPEVLDLNQVIRGLGKMLGRLIGEDVEITTQLADDLGKVNVDPGQIEQLILNLAVNARDAMFEGGQLTIETQNVTFDDLYERMNPDTPAGNYVMVAASDTGCGMDRATVERIFEPFFTTKEKGKGTGLGLSTVYGIVKQAGGSIHVYSEPGQGTTFRLYFPRVEGEAKGAARATAEVTDLTGSETILVVEDEAAVRELVRRICASVGYTVFTAPNGGEALRICQQRGNKIDLVLTDVVMPKMGGKELATRISEANPSIKVLYMSGYTENSIVHHGVLDDGIHFISKPFSAPTLLTRLRRILDGTD